MVRKNSSQEITRALNVLRSAYGISTGTKNFLDLDSFLFKEINSLDDAQKNMMNKVVMHEYDNDVSSLSKYFPKTLSALDLDTK